MTDNRRGKSNPTPDSQDSVPVGERGGVEAKDQGKEKPTRDNETKNHSQVAAVPAAGADPDKKLRRTSKREKGSRKPGTELTKEEQTAHAN